jgi:transcription elongation factor Elf1
MVKKVIEDFEFEKCPVCGARADWTGSEVDKESYCDNYVCDNCGKHYTIVFDMYYSCHWVEE